VFDKFELDTGRENVVIHDGLELGDDAAAVAGSQNRRTFDEPEAQQRTACLQTSERTIRAVAGKDRGEPSARLTRKHRHHRLEKIAHRLMVLRSRRARYSYASRAVSPHISNEASNELQTAGRSGLPKIAQR
jgi:hypothetical protein